MGREMPDFLEVLGFGKYVECFFLLPPEIELAGNQPAGNQTLQWKFPHLVRSVLFPFKSYLWDFPAMLDATEG